MVGSLLRHRRLIREFTRRDVEGRYRGSILGLVWSFLNPLFLLAIYTLVFGTIFQAKWPQMRQGNLREFALVLFCGLIVLNVFGECLARGPGLIVSAPNYVKKVVFPLEILPAAAVGSAVFHGSVSLLVLVGANVAIRGALPLTLLLVPLVALPLALLSLGTTWFLASLGVFVRDIGHLTGVATTCLMFLTPVFYPVEALPEGLRVFVRLNPLTAVVEDLRRVVLWGELPDAWRLLGSLAISAVAAVLGYTWFMKTKRAFADVI